ncbi:hypothetical protein B9Z55_022994 [Caenorhabditis nigoni]|uniref:Uncharacterized protein n=2 Tax=Caenorhabditis nigoni TaxID=1611254 RepID=A0A2G5SN65_9PELO|nr:hypothetical protein B9Z55_022994 [Caenorhabditis nigoni]
MFDCLQPRTSETPTEMCEERYRLVVLGSAKVGKTNIIRRYLYNDFSNKYKETIEDLHSREFRIQGIPLPLDILDTNFNFPDMRRLSIASASAFLLVFSVDDVTSFKEMSDLWQEICTRRSDLNELPIVVVGNKCDVENKKIFEDTAKAFTSRLSSDVRYVEVSAKDNIRITEVFRTLLELSGFPRCKAGGGGLDDVAEDEETKNSPTIRRSATVRAKSSSKRESRRTYLEDENRAGSTNGGAQSSPREQPQLDKQVSHPVLAVPLHLGDLKRNLSLRMKSPRRDKEQVERKLSDEQPKQLSRSSSLIRRTKHLSLKMRRHGEKSNKEEVVDESDCKIQ